MPSAMARTILARSACPILPHGPVRAARAAATAASTSALPAVWAWAVTSPVIGYRTSNVLPVSTNLPLMKFGSCRTVIFLRTWQLHLLDTKCSAAWPHARSAASLAAFDSYLAEGGELAGHGRAGRGEDGVGDATGQHDLAGLDSQATAGQVVGGQRQRLAGVSLYVGASAGVLELAADVDLDLLVHQIDVVGLHHHGSGRPSPAGGVVGDNVTGSETEVLVPGVDDLGARRDRLDGGHRGLAGDTRAGQ